MQPQPEFIRANYRGSGRLDGKRALTTGGDSGIGRAVAVHFAAEGAAAVRIVYRDEHGDAAETERLVEAYGARCVRIQGDITEPDCAARAVRELTAKTSPRIDVLAAYRGSPKLIDYSATKGAITTFTRSLAGSLVERGIRVSAVAPGPIWTPLIPASFPPDKVRSFGKDTPMKRAG